VVLPSGLVLNAQIVHNDSGSHLRLVALDLKGRTVTLSILDGVQGGKQYFYHLVTDASVPIAAVLEKGVYAPTLAEIPAFAKSAASDDSALLGFSSVLNGRTDKGSGDQGFSTALANGIDPINVFPVGPENDNAAQTNNYSPLWDAHVSMWTKKAISANKVHRIHSMGEQKELIVEGYLTSAGINPPGPGNPYVGGLRPTRAIISPSARGMIVTDGLRTLKSASASFGRTRLPFFPSFLRTGSHTSKTSAYRCFLSRYGL
jgi:hypothetical protein